MLSQVGVGVWGWDGLNGNKANVSPSKLMLADILLALSLAIEYISSLLYKLVLFSSCTFSDIGNLKLVIIIPALL